MNQSLFTALGAGDTQNHKVARMLAERLGEWVPMPELAAAMDGFAVHSRISDLRRLGFTIEHRNEHHAGKIQSFYRLLESAPQFAGAEIDKSRSTPPNFQ